MRRVTTVGGAQAGAAGPHGVFTNLKNILLIEDSKKFKKVSRLFS